jgi:hypothetical protein
LPDDQRAQENIPRAHQIRMQAVGAAPAVKEQTSVFSIGLAGVATPWTGLTGVIGIYLSLSDQR